MSGSGMFRHSQSATETLIGQASTYKGAAGNQVDAIDSNQRKQMAGLGEGNAGSTELQSVSKQSRDRAVTMVDKAGIAHAASLKGNDIKGQAMNRAVTHFGNRA